MGRPRDACLPPPPPLGRQGAEGPPVFPPAPLRAAQRNRETPSGGVALLSAHTPPSRAARRQGNADLRSAPLCEAQRNGALPIAKKRGDGLERRPPVGTAARRAAAVPPPNRRDGSLLGAYPTKQSGAQARERRPPVGTRWPPASARRIAHWRRGAPLPTYPTGQSGAQARERRPPVGTRWPPASARRIAQWRRGAPLHTYPTKQSGAQARERRPPVGTRWPPASARRIAQWRRGAPLPTYATGQTGAQARERRPPVGTRWPRPAHGAWPSGGVALLSAHTPPSRAARRPGNAASRAVLPVGPGTAPGRGETPTPLPARSVLLRTMAGEIPSYPDLRNAR